MPKTSRERIAEQFLAAADDAADTLRSQAELRLITELCRALADLGLGVGMSDARPAAVIHIRDEPSLWITVDPSGEFFEWNEAQHRHPASDPAGAAALVSEHVKAQRSGPGEAS
jgi:hypothetical protein